MLLRPWKKRFTMIIIFAWWLRISSKFSGPEFEKISGTLDRWKLLSRCRFPHHEVAIAVKSLRIVQYLASDAVRRQEDKFAQQQQHLFTAWM